MTQLSSDAKDRLLSVFREEATELLAEMESALLALEEHPDDRELIGRVFRAMHTIKGSGAMFGFDEVVLLTHSLETVFEQVRAGQLAATTELVGLALQGKDLIRALLEGPPPGPRENQELIEALHHVSGAAGPPAAGEAPVPESNPAATYRIRFRPYPELLQDGTNPLGLLRELTELGPCRIVAHTRAVPPLEQLSPECCYFSWDIILTTDQGENAVRDVFIFVEDRCDLQIVRIDDGEQVSPESYKKLGEILIERGDLSAVQLSEALRDQKRLGDLLAERGAVHVEEVQAAIVEQQMVREVRAQRESSQAQNEASSIRVAAEKLDGLVDLVGELVIAQARLSQIAGERDDPELLAVAEDIGRLSAELRDNTLNIRMIPIGTTFSRFKRLVRDLSAELGKEIELQTEGAETELDKTVMERLGDPLVHLIRNSCDHGIELPAERLAAGKPSRGKVRLAAYQSGSHVVIEIHDDGAGLDAEAIRAKAVERGLIEAEARLTDKELFQLIFLPGFSTARTVSNVSGRGVGMDVVKRSVEALRGSVEVESTHRVGTTLRIRLPLTLAIIEGLLVAVGDGRFVLPMSLVEECIEITSAEVERANGSSLVAVRGELVPYLRLRDWFVVQGRRPPIEQITIVTAEGVRFGFVIDAVIGQHQTVIKTLGRMYRDSQGLSGATILGDGTVALIIDAPAIIRSVTAGELAA